MRDNEFDRGVQEKMGEFRLPPSAPVWVEVERRIRERKRRRILFFWFCMAGLLLAGLGGWWIMNENGTTTESTDTRTLSVLKKANQPDQVDQKKKSTGPAPISKDVKPGAIDATVPETRNEFPVSSISNPVKDKPVVQVKTKALHEKIQQKDKVILPGTKSELNLSKGMGKKGKIPVKKSAPVVPVIRPATAPVTAMAAGKADAATTPLPVPEMGNNRPVTPIQNADVAVIQSTPADTMKAVVVQQQITEPEAYKKKPAVPEKWQTGIQLGVGGTRLTSGISIGSTKSLDMIQSGGGLNNNPGAGGTFNQSYADSVPLKGPAFQAGVFAKKQAGKNIAFSIGLNLAYFSGKQRVGSFVDSLRNSSNYFNAVTISSGFYRTGGTARFTNRYYYVQLPILLLWQLNKGLKMPVLYFENGLVPSMMAGSRALVYDPGGRIFFRDKKVYNSFSLLGQTGLTADLFSNKRNRLSVGLYYNYQFSRLQKISPPDFNHLSSFGIQLRWTKKK